jgi:two-component system, NtrC family, sensor kinase
VDDAHAVVRVRDDGAGILPEHRDRLFDPFFTTKPAGEGTGLGLYISHQIVRGHGGEIAVTSAPGRGATFEVRLPLAPSEGDGTRP